MVQNNGNLRSLAGLRMDGRKDAEIRRIRTTFGVLPSADGSVYLEQGNTKLVVVVNGPRPNVRRGSGDRVEMNCEYRISPFATSERKEVRVGDRKLVEHAHTIVSTFEAVVVGHLYPNTGLDISIDIIQADGGMLAASINAVSLALMDAGVALIDFVVASSVAMVEGHYFTDLNSMEQNANYPNATLAVVPSRMHLNVLQMECKLPMVAFEELISVGKNACMQMHEILKDNIQTHTWKRLAARDTL